MAATIIWQIFTHDGFLIFFLSLFVAGDLKFNGKVMEFFLQRIAGFCKLFSNLFEGKNFLNILLKICEPE